MKEFDLPIIIQQDQEGFFAFSPDLQGCYSQGSTYEEVLVNIKDAIKLHLQDRVAEKEELPLLKSISLSTVHISL